MEGQIFLIGCGIKKGHMTLEGMKALRESDILLYDRLIDKEIIGKLDGKKIYAGKEVGESSRQDAINKMLYKYAKQGKTVARLKGGDSFLFSRGFEEYEYLKSRGINVKVIPGISAHHFLGELGIPLTQRMLSSAVSLITGSKADGSSLNYTGLDADTLVFYMPVGNLGKIVDAVKKKKRGKKNIRCFLVENAFKEDYRVIGGSLDTIVELAREAKVSTPALFVVSPCRRRIYAKKILTFRQEGKEAETIEKLSGFEVMNYPLYEIKHRKVKSPDAKVYAFTSPNAVESVFSQHKLSGEFIAIGDRTAEALMDHGVKSHVPETQFSTGLMEYLKKYGKKDTVVFCSPHTRVKGYRKVYAYDVIYKNRNIGLGEIVKKTEALFITSSEILNVLCDSVPPRSLNTKIIVALGPKVAVTAKKRGVHVDVMLEKPLVEELKKEITAKWKSD